MRTLQQWLETLPKRPGMAVLVVLVGSIITLAGFVENVGTIFRKLGDLAESAQILGVAPHYVRPGGGQFTRLSDGYWLETTKGQLTRFLFQERRQDKEYVYLYDSSRLNPHDSTDPFALRIPKAGGVIQWSYEKSPKWTDLFVACRDVCRGDQAPERREQAP